MKRLFKAAWSLGGPLRRPIIGKIQSLIKASVDQSLAECVQPPMRELLVGVGKARTEVGVYRNETNLLLDSLVREVVRLQDELESLRSERNEARSSHPPLSLSNPLAESA